EDAARLHGFGGGADIQISERTLVSLGARVWTGSSDGIAKTGAFDLTGYEVIQRLTITLP
ncbi:MAG TPA: hypothetical protein VLB27_11225, partial [candidate division Zixibacteria bacterium]|nr:hypothetical protein [candidate division Zixibacteria bacterium]